MARTLGIAKGLEIEEGKASKNVERKVKEVRIKCGAAMENFRFNDALIAIWELISFCDKYINEEKLWQTKDAKVINDLFFALNEIASMLAPFMPETSAKIEAAARNGESRILFPKLL